MNMWMEIFLQAGLQPAELSGVIQRIKIPDLKLKNMNLFTQEKIRAEHFAVDVVDGMVNLIKTSMRGAPLETQDKIKGILKRFGTSRIAKKDHILASFFQFVRQYGTTEQIVEIQAEFIKRMNGPSGLISQVDYTKENLMLGAVQGIVLDSDDSVIVNWFNELDITQATESAWDFTQYDGSDAKGGLLRKLLTQKVTRPMEQKAKGARYSGVHCFAGSDYFDELVGCGETQKLYENQQVKNEMIDGYLGRTFKYANILFEEYSGDVSTTVKIADDEAKFFPAGAGNSVFKEILAPGETFADIGTEGQEIYAMTVPDLDRDQFVDLEVYSYPAYVCQRPEMLQRGALV